MALIDNLVATPALIITELLDPEVASVIPEVAEAVKVTVSALVSLTVDIVVLLLPLDIVPVLPLKVPAPVKANETPVLDVTLVVLPY